MLKDIEFKKVENIAIAIVPENEEDIEPIWLCYIINLSNTKIDTVLINSTGYGTIDNKEYKTATMRWFVQELQPNEAAHIEVMMEETTKLNNEFWVSFYQNGEIQDKKYIFVQESISKKYLTEIPIVNKRGILIS